MMVVMGLDKGRTVLHHNSPMPIQSPTPLRGLGLSRPEYKRRYNAAWRASHPSYMKGYDRHYRKGATAPQVVDLRVRALWDERFPV